MNELNFGSFIRKERMALGLSLSEVAGDLGCSSPHLSNLETGKQIPSNAMIEKLSTFFEIPKDDLSNRAEKIRTEQTLKKLPFNDVKDFVSFYMIKKEAGAK